VNVLVEQVIPNGSIAIGIGTDVATGNRIRFGGDHRPMADIALAIEGGADDIEVEIESWQILGVSAP
jgi:hypothetical protein